MENPNKMKAEPWANQFYSFRVLPVRVFVYFGILVHYHIFLPLHTWGHPHHVLLVLGVGQRASTRRRPRRMREDESIVLRVLWVSMLIPCKLLSTSCRHYSAFCSLWPRIWSSSVTKAGKQLLEHHFLLACTTQTLTSVRDFTLKQNKPDKWATFVIPTFIFRSSSLWVHIVLNNSR